MIQDDGIIRSTERDVKAFLASPVYHDFKVFAELRLEALIQKLSNDEQIQEIDRMQGAIKNCQDFIDFFDGLVEDIKTQDQITQDKEIV